jgi:hypothetical protein
MLHNLTNFANIIRDRMVKKEVLPTDLIALGRTDKNYDGGYRPIAITAEDLLRHTDNTILTAHYTLDITSTNVVNVNTVKGIIDIENMGLDVAFTPDPDYGSSVSFLINNPNLDITFANRDNIYIQYSVYYNQAFGDNVIPCLISTGVTNGLGFTLYNANPTVAGLNNWTGALYVYYELYTIN